MCVGVCMSVIKREKELICECVCLREIENKRERERVSLPLNTKRTDLLESAGRR